MDSPTTVPILSWWAIVVTFTFATVLALLVGAPDFLIPFLKFFDFCGQLLTGNTVPAIHAWTTRTALSTPTNEVLLPGMVLLIMMTFHSDVDCMHVPMLHPILCLSCMSWTFSFILSIDRSQCNNPPQGIWTWWCSHGALRGLLLKSHMQWQWARTINYLMTTPRLETWMGVGASRDWL
jgi:hypothetical protein